MSEKTEHSRKNWDFSQSLRAILEKHTLELSDEELEEVSLSIRDNIPEKTIKEWLQLPLSCMRWNVRFGDCRKLQNNFICSFQKQIQK